MKSELTVNYNEKQYYILNDLKSKFEIFDENRLRY